MTIILAGTGHRPDKLGGYGQHVADRLYMLAHIELNRIKPNEVISGMALGWDQALAIAALDLGIRVRAYIPFSGQEKRWPRESQLRYHQLLDRCRKTAWPVYVCEGDYASWKMNRRNEAMVDDATHVLALWNGSAGGTANCVFYAKRKGVPVHNCWDRWIGGVKQKEMKL